MKRILLMTMALAALAGCGKPAVLPTGVQTVTGTVERAPLSLDRRGTHVLRQNDEDVYFLESSQVNLTAYEGLQVTLQGTLEPNSDASALPVLIVSAVTGGDDELLKAVSIPSLHVTLQVPGIWKLRADGDVAQFSSPEPAKTFLTLFLQPLEGVPFDDRSASGLVIPSSVHMTPFIVGSRRAMRLYDESTLVEKLVVDRGENAPPEKRVLVLQFAPLNESNDTRSQVRNEQIERSLQLSETLTASSAASSTSSVDVMPSSGSAGSASSDQPIQGKPCGGAAGVLCPAGYYCDVSQTGGDSGRCTKL